MSYATEKLKAGRKPCTIVELELDRCNLTYGTAPCTAAIGVTGERKCFNTRATCQDADNYDITAGAAAALLSDPFTSLTGWTSLAGSPVMAGGVFGGGIVARNIGTGNGFQILAAVGSPPTGGDTALIYFCADFSGGPSTENYALFWTATGWQLIKDQGATILDSYVAAPQAGDTIDIRVIDDGEIEVWINGVRQLSDPDTDYRSSPHTYIALVVNNASATIAIDPTEGAFVVIGGSVTTGKKSYRFCKADEEIPPSIGAIPSLIDINLAPTQLSVDGGLGKRASVTVMVQDHPHHDRDTDPYVTSRSYTPMERGTYWGKLKARNPYYQGRLLKIYTGYIGEAFDLAENFESRLYVIERIDGPDSKGRVSITAKDILKLADNDRAKYPRATDGRLSIALTDVEETSLSLAPAGVGSEVFSDGSQKYPDTGGLVRIGDEVIAYASRTGDTLSTLDRARFGTTAAAHSADEVVQICKSVTSNAVSAWLSSAITAADTSLTLLPSGIGSESFADGTNKFPAGGGTVRIGTEVVAYSARSGDVLSGLTRGLRNTTAAAHVETEFVYSVGPYVADIIWDLLVNTAQIAAEYIDLGGWYGETNNWLQQSRFDACLTDPVGANDLITELTSHNLIYLWWDEREQLIKLRAIAPPRSTPRAVTDEENIVAGSVRVSEDPGRRLSAIWFYYAKRDPTQNDESKNYGEIHLRVDAEAESAEEYNDSRTKVLKSRFFNGANRGQVLALSSRLLNRMRDVPRLIRFNLDAKDSEITIGDVIDLDSMHFQDATGANASTRVQVVSVAEVEDGTTFEYTAEEFQYTGRYWFIGPDSLPDYSDATDQQKLAYGFICPDTGIFEDGSLGYRII